MGRGGALILTEYSRCQARCRALSRALSYLTFTGMVQGKLRNGGILSGQLEMSESELEPRWVLLQRSCLTRAISDKTLSWMDVDFTTTQD